MSAFNPEVFKWARETASLDLQSAAHALDLSSIDRLIKIESGEEEPSRSLLLRMSKQYRRSLLTFYLPVPPKKGNRGHDFRTVTADRTVKSDAHIDVLIRDVLARQSLMKSTFEDEDDVPLPFIGSLTMQDGVDKVVQAIRETLDFDLDEFRAKKQSDKAFLYLREKAESAGIFVLLIGNLGSHHTAISVESFRGFALADPSAPFVVINDQDAKTAWSFTLLHELAHLWLGQTGVSGAIDEASIERFCNEVASSILLPHQELQSLNLAGLNLEDQTAEIAQFALNRNISRQMVAYNLFRRNIISKSEWHRIDNRFKELWADEKAKQKVKNKISESGPNYYVIRRHRLGNALLEFASRNLRAGTISPIKAARLLGVKPRSIYPLLSETLGGNF